MSLMASIQRFLGVDPVKMDDQFQKAERGAQITCTRCGVFVSHESQDLHKRWHQDLARETSRPVGPPR